MTFRAFVDEATSLIGTACETLGYTVPPKLDWDIPPTKELGDVSFRVGYQLSKIARKKPADIAKEIAEVIETRLGNSKVLVSEVEGHSSGFLNFRFNPQKLFT